MLLLYVPRISLAFVSGRGGWDHFPWTLFGFLARKWMHWINWSLDEKTSSSRIFLKISYFLRSLTNVAILLIYALFVPQKWMIIFPVCTAVRTNYQPSTQARRSHRPSQGSLCAVCCQCPWGRWWRWSCHFFIGIHGRTQLQVGGVESIDLVGRERSWDKMTSSSGGLQEGNHGKGRVEMICDGNMELFLTWMSL